MSYFDSIKEEIKTAIKRGVGVVLPRINLPAGKLNLPTPTFRVPKCKPCLPTGKPNLPSLEGMNISSPEGMNISSPEGMNWPPIKREIIMKKTCKNCTHCKISLDNDAGGVSPGGIMFITYYKCNNEESEYHNDEISVIMNTESGGTIDSRENQSCDKHK